LSDYIFNLLRRPVNSAHPYISLGPFSLREKDRMREVLLRFSPLTPTLSRREREKQCALFAGWVSIYDTNYITNSRMLK